MTMLRDFDCEVLRDRMAEVIAVQMDTAREQMRPFYLLAPHMRVYPDGDQWCALYGENMQDGVVGFGDTPEAATQAFDAEWSELSQEAP